MQDIALPKRKFPWWIAGVAVAALGTAGVVLFPRAPEKPKITTAAIDKGDVVVKVTATGTLSAIITVQVGAQVSGRITEIDADFNSTVKKNQVIARIDRQLLDEAVVEAKANLVAAQAAVDRAKVQSENAVVQRDRARELAKSNLIAKADLDTAELAAKVADADLGTAQANLEQMKSQLDRAQVNVSYATIYSPIDGVVISRAVDVGQTVAASLQAPTLFTIAQDLKKMQVDTSVGEADIGKITEGMDATFTVDAYPGQRFVGKVRQIRNAPQTVQNVVTYDVIIDVDNSDLRLRPGMTANASFTVATKTDVLRIPNAALRFKAPKSFTGGIAKAGDKGAKPGEIPSDGASSGHAHGKRKGGGGAEGSTPSTSGVPSTSGASSTSGAPSSGTSSTSGVASHDGTDAAKDDRGAPPEPVTASREVWVQRGDKDKTLPTSVKIKTGLSDGTFTEVIEGDLHEGDDVVTEATDPSDKGGSGGPPGGGMPRRMF
jgi:HlyD family secretion protein